MVEIQRRTISKFLSRIDILGPLYHIHQIFIPCGNIQPLICHHCLNIEHLLRLQGRISAFIKETVVKLHKVA